MHAIECRYSYVTHLKMTFGLFKAENYSFCHFITLYSIPELAGGPRLLSLRIHPLTSQLSILGLNPDPANNHHPSISKAG